MAQLTGPAEAEARVVQGAVLELGEPWVAVIDQRLGKLAGSADRAAMQRLLGRARRAARAEVRRRMRERGDEGEVVTPDYLDLLLAHAGPESPHMAPLKELVACSRALEAIGSPSAVRGLISVYVRFGELLRADTQLALSRLGPRAIAPLIEATRHPAPQVAEWAAARLARLDKSEASSAVEGLSPELTADVLRAYGRNQDLSALPLLIAHAGSARDAVRRAAREAVTHIGPAGLWPLRDAFEAATGEPASEAWPWDRLARELFARFDGQRLAHHYALFDRGRRALSHGDLEGATRAFDELLARDPGFQRAAELAPAYLRLAERLLVSDTPRATLALQRVARLSPRETQHFARAQSLLHTLKASDLRSRGWVDQVLLLRALELDPSNRAAQRMLEEAQRAVAPSAQGVRRYLPASAIALLTIFSLAAMALRHRRAPDAEPKGS